MAVAYALVRAASRLFSMLGRIESNRVRRTSIQRITNMQLSLLPYVCLLTLPIPAQEPIRVDVKLINVGFAVRDSTGKLVMNLNQDDFEVFEDGAPQKISFFAK